MGINKYSIYDFLNTYYGGTFAKILKRFNFLNSF